MASDIASAEKWRRLTHPTRSAVIALWGYAMRHENGGRVPSDAAKFIPDVTTKRLAELEEKGWLHRNGDGWVIHDWEEHQEDALKIQDRKRKDRDRKRRERRRDDEEV